MAADETISLTWSTEQRNPRTMGIDLLASEPLVDLILSEDETVAPLVRGQADQIGKAVDLGVEALRAGGRIHYVGAGTSGRLGMIDAVELLPTYRVGPEVVVGHMAGGPDALLKAKEGAEDDEAAGKTIVDEAGDADLIVGITASGRTPYVRGALQAARARGLATVLVACNPQAPLAGLADVAILVDTGPEVITGSTRMKSATAQKLILNSFSTAIMVRLGKTLSNLMIDLLPTNQKLHRRMVRILEQATDADQAQAQAALAAAEGNLRTALVMLLADVETPVAIAALASSPGTQDDPSGIRSAAAAAARSA